MYKIYLKQAWALIRQERLFSSVYIVGTGLAISLVMVLSIVLSGDGPGPVADREERCAEE